MDLTLIIALLLAVVTAVYFFLIKQSDVPIPTYSSDSYSVVVKDKDGTCPSKFASSTRPSLALLPLPSAAISPFLTLSMCAIQVLL